MNTKLIYLDHSATTPLLPEVLKAMEPYFIEKYGNASSLHTMGQVARQAIEDSRKKIASFLGAKPEELIFTGGGTESDNIAILGTARKLKDRGKHLITTNIEHPAVKNTFKQLEKEGFDVTYVPVQKNGIVDVDDVMKAIHPDTILISIMYVNNEIGTIQPVEKIAELVEPRGIIVHTDAVQAFGKLRMNMAKSKIHLLSASAHKIYGPKGIGLLYIRGKGKLPNIGSYIEPIIYGGGHESGFRPSTENVPEIIGFSKAVEIADKTLEEDTNRITKLRDDFIQWVLKNIPESYLNGDPKERIYNNINLGFKYIEGESLILYLDLEGIQASTGSACSSKNLEPSHVLLALGLEKKDAHGSLRLTLGKSTNLEDLEYTKNKLKEVVEKLRKFSPLNKLKI